MLLKLCNLLEFAFFVRMIVCTRKRQLWQPWCKIFFKIWNFSALNPRKTQTFPSFCKNHLLLKTFVGTRRMQLSQRWRKVVSEDQISFKSMPRNDFKKKCFSASNFNLYRKILWRRRNQFWQMGKKLFQTPKNDARNPTVEEKTMFFSRSLFFLDMILCTRRIQFWKLCWKFCRKGPISLLTVQKWSKH